ncbi:zinc-dependent peptidase [Massilia sp. YIM B02769]|uniref:M90 family metallopeptidase n=1 Tax=Massilia sp. YIM B02769 TaxID=3050129 RepID=UPI0025B69DD0|nr:M90 family metallopeptidase [Massilia sp. YIM B02769]MDN4060499.1 zinc-dependent peptidase [Massilia sp. YIM B02769]
MEALLTVSALVAAGLLAWAIPRWRLRRALSAPLPPAALDTLARNVEQYRGMDAAQRSRLERLVRRFLHEKTFVGCAGLDITDEMRVTIAGQACLLLLGTKGELVYPTLHSVLVYPGAFLVPRRQVDEAGVVSEERQDLLGESWGDGRVILSWDHVRRAGGDDPGHNVVLHEFAHQLDSESGSTNGAPYLGSAERYRSWSEVLSRDFDALRHDAWFGQQGVLDHYGATNPAEFFAVATEAFFEQPHRLAERHTALFEEFLKYYRVDPCAWSAPPAPVPDYGMVYGQWQ